MIDFILYLWLVGIKLHNNNAWGCLMDDIASMGWGGVKYEGWRPTVYSTFILIWGSQLYKDFFIGYLGFLNQCDKITSIRLTFSIQIHIFVPWTIV